MITVRDPRKDPRNGDVVKDPDGFFIYVTTRTPRKVFTKPFGNEKPMMWCLSFSLGFWRRRSKDCEVVITNEA